jgi:hypothetical protein
MYEMITERTALLTVKKAAVYMDRTEKAIRHLYERGTLTPIRIDGRVQIDPNEIDFLIAKAKQSAQYWHELEKSATLLKFYAPDEKEKFCADTRSDAEGVLPEAGHLVQAAVQTAPEDGQMGHVAGIHQMPKRELRGGDSLHCEAWVRTKKISFSTSISW